MDETITFSVDINEPVTYRWTFGDGTESTLPQPKHVYKKPGKYTVSLEVTSILTGKSKRQLVGEMVTIHPKPYADFDFDVLTPEDFKGLKMRVPMQEVFIETAKAFGANPQELAAIDIYQALQTGVIDGQDNPPANIWDFKMYEVSKYLTVTNYATGPDPFIVNLKWYNTLTPELKIIFDQVAKETMARSDEMNKEKESEYLDMLSKYLQINFITDERLIPFQKAVKPVYDYFINKGMFTMDEIQTAQNFAKNLK